MLSIELHTAASPVVIPMIRAVAADLAARASFEVDSSDDRRMAVDDACAVPAQPGHRRRVRIILGKHAVTALPWD